MRRRKVSPAGLARILAQHILWLATDGKDGQCADLSRSDLRGVDLRDVDLREAIRGICRREIQPDGASRLPAPSEAAS